MITTFNVTKKDIDKGEVCSEYNCPVARAIKRKIKNHYYVHVQPEEVFLENFKTDRCFTFKLPQVANNFINKFDTTQFFINITFEPFKFKLNIPKRILKEKRGIPQKKDA